MCVSNVYVSVVCLWSELCVMYDVDGEGVISCTICLIVFNQFLYCCAKISESVSEVEWERVKNRMIKILGCTCE